MAKSKPNHPHDRDEPAQRAAAPNTAPPEAAPGPSAPGMQERDPKRRTGQFGGAGDTPLIKK